MSPTPPPHVARSIRWPAAILIFAAAAVLLLDGGIGGREVVLIETGAEVRKSFFAGMSGTAGAVLGFFTATIAILVALDPRRPIVQQLRLGESMTLLVVNILAGCLWVLVLAGLSIAGWLMPALGGRPPFAFVYEVLGVAAFVEFLVGGFFFTVVTIKVARHD